MDHKERIKRMAVEAGAKPLSGYLTNKPDVEFLERFAALVAEDCAKLGEEWADAVDPLKHPSAYATAKEIRARFGLGE